MSTAGQLSIPSPCAQEGPERMSLGQGLATHTAQTQPPCRLSDTSSPPCLGLCSCHPPPGMPFLQSPLNSGLDSAVHKERSPSGTGIASPLCPCPMPIHPAVVDDCCVLCVSPEMRTFLFTAVSSTPGAGPDALQVLSNHLCTGHVPARVAGPVLSSGAGGSLEREQGATSL